MRKLLLSSAAAFALLCDHAAAEISGAEIPEEALTPDQVEFLKAAKFFLLGRDGPDSPQMKSAHLRYNYPCSVWTWPNQFMRRIEFNKFPALSEIRIFRDRIGMWNVQVPLPKEAVCARKVDGVGVVTPDSGYCSSQISFADSDLNRIKRRLKALQYIKDKFCPGLPAPPEPPY
jgi:hypothetical protein